MGQKAVNKAEAVTTIAAAANCLMTAAPALDLLRIEQLFSIP